MNELKNYYKEIILVLVMCVALIFATDSLPGIYMPDSITMTLLAIFAVVVAIFLVFIWKANPKDERESLHDWYSGRVGYSLGILLLSVGSIVQAVNHQVDPWLAWSLVIMVVGRVVAKFVLDARF